jgi:lipopolysaccharide export system permease protein
MGEKWANEELITPFFGAWMANILLLPFGFFFLRQARLDARLFDTDFYDVIVDRIKNYLQKLFKNQKFFILLNR